MKNQTFHNYAFFSVDKNIAGLTLNKLQKYKQEFIKKIESQKEVITHTYSILGFKGGISLMVWFSSGSPEKNQQLLNDLLHTSLGKFLEIKYTLFGMTRQSIYNAKPIANNESLTALRRLPFLIIYPFTKTKDWYLLGLEKRKEMMREHIRTGFKFAYIRQLLLYAFGVDDHEFILSYETERLDDFQDLVMALRTTRGRLYTLNDLPIFVCLYHPLKQALDNI